MQAFNKYLKSKDAPWKYQTMADAMLDIYSEDECNDTYGRFRMYQALQLKQPDGVHIPGERTVYRVMEEIGLNHKPKRKPNGITKADKEARKSDDLKNRRRSSADVFPLRNEGFYPVYRTGAIPFFCLSVMILCVVPGVVLPCRFWKFTTKKLHYLNDTERLWDMDKSILIIIPSP